jgi:hypothetical protein
MEPDFWADASWEEAASPRASQATGGNIASGDTIGLRKGYKEEDKKL